MIGNYFWIVGFGKFGQRALKKLRYACPSEIRLDIVDSNPANFDYFDNINYYNTDGIDWLYSAMKRAQRADWIIPALPLHVASEFLCKKIAEYCLFMPELIPKTLIKKFPNAVSNKYGQMTASYSNWICPIDCCEPENSCTINGKTRPMSMIELVKGFDDKKIQSIIVESKQLLPGVGGYKPEDLDFAMKKVIKCACDIFMVTTACKCHAIMNLVKII